MKAILTLFFTIVCYSVFATDYPFKDLKRTDAYDFQNDVIYNSEPIIVIFLNGQCLFYSTNNRSCLLGEKMIDQTLKSIAPGLQVRFVDMNEDGYLLSYLNITKLSTLVLFIDGQQIEKIEGLSGYDLFTNFHSLNQRVLRN
jgi:hypothetical protein